MYQLAKLRMLEFYSNFLDLNVKEFELIQIDMDIHKNIFSFSVQSPWYNKFTRYQP